MSNVREKVKKIVMEQLSVDENKITDQARFIDDMGADSLDIIEMVMAFEEAFECEIPDEETEKIATFGDAVLYLEKATK